MNLTELINYHLFAFYILGQSSNIGLLKSHNHFITIAQFTPSFLLLLLAGPLSIASIVLQFVLAAHFDRSDSVIGIIFILSELISSSTVIGQSFFRRKQLMDVIDSFHSIEQALRQDFQFSDDYQTFCRSYLSKVSLVAFLFSLMIFIKLAMPTAYTFILLEITFTAMRLISLVARLHVLFYVSLLKHFVIIGVDQTVYEKLTVNRMVLWRVQNVIELMKKLKCLHFKLYVAATQISDVFGWSLVTESVQIILDGAYLCYWIVFFLQKANQKLFVIRKYTFDKAHSTFYKFNNITFRCNPYLQNNSCKGKTYDSDEEGVSCFR